MSPQCRLQVPKFEKNTKITISRATEAEADLPLIKPLLAELIEDVEDVRALMLRWLENCHALLNDAACHVLVAREGQRIVGFINFTTRQSVLHPGLSGIVDELVVAQSARSRGIGRLLVQAAIDKCRQFGCCELEVSTEKSNAAARRFYRSCGFHEDAVLLEMEM